MTTPEAGLLTHDSFARAELPDRAARPPRGPAGGSAATPLRTFVLDPECRRRAARIGRPGGLPPVETEPEAWEAAGRERLTGILGRRTRALRLLMQRSEAVLVRGLAADADAGAAAYGADCDPERISCAVSQVLGVVALIGAKAFAFRDENQGRLIRHVVARPCAAGEVSSQGWDAELPWHMDGAYRPFREGERLARPARWLVFAVINSDPEVPMTIVSTVELVRRLSPATQSALAQPEFAVSSPAAVTERCVARNLPLLDRDEAGRLISRISLGLCDGLTPRAARALREVSEALADPSLHHRINLRCGDLVVLDNWRTLHRRKAYSPAWNGRDRWLIRIYAAPEHEAGPCGRARLMD